jgi:thiamine kinase-like enzyme
VKALNQAFGRIPLLKDHQPEDFKIQRLPGLTNHSFHLKSTESDWVLRIPKTDTNEYIDRNAEARNNDMAIQLGLAPKCLWRDDSGLSLTMTLAHTQSPSAQDLCEPEILNEILRKIIVLHNSNEKFQGSVNLRTLLERYFSLIPTPRQSSIYGDFSNALQRLTDLEKRDHALTPSHNDLILQNILIDTSGRTWFIDWEYSSMASPYWDLATLCNTAGFDFDQSVNLLSIYAKQTNTGDIDLLMEYRHVLRILTLCWTMAFSTAHR